MYVFGVDYFKAKKKKKKKKKSVFYMLYSLKVNESIFFDKT